MNKKNINDELYLVLSDGNNIVARYLSYNMAKDIMNTYIEDGYFNACIEKMEYENNIKYMPENVDILDLQISLQARIIELANVNLVSCGNCGQPILHQIGETVLTCPACNFNDDISSFPDVYYKGMDVFIN